MKKADKNSMWFIAALFGAVYLLGKKTQPASTGSGGTTGGGSTVTDVQAGSDINQFVGPLQSPMNPIPVIHCIGQDGAAFDSTSGDCGYFGTPVPDAGVRAMPVMMQSSVPTVNDI